MDSGPKSSTEWTQREPLLVVFWFTLGGIVADRSLAVPWSLWGAATVIAWTTWWLFGRLDFRRGSRCCLALSIFALAALWHHVYWHVYPAHEIARYVGKEGQLACLQVQVKSSPRRIRLAQDEMSLVVAPEQTRFEAVANAIRTPNNRWQAICGQVRVRVHGHDLAVAPGDSIHVYGRLYRARPAMNPDGWSPQDHARSDRRLCFLDVHYPDCVLVQNRASSFDPRWYLPKIKGWARDRLRESFPSSTQGLAIAVMLGDREFVSQSTLDSFLVTGTIHLLAISGLHVGILAYALLSLLTICRCPRAVSLWGVIFFCLFYAMLTGGRAPVLRATVVVGVSCLSLLTHRPAFSFNGLAMAALIVLAVNPAQVFSAGAQLSFLAVVGIAWIVPWLSNSIAGPISRRLYATERSFLRMIAAHIVRKLLTVTLSTCVIWLLAMPLVMHHFHLASPIALVLNPVLWIPLSIALFAGLSATLLSLVSKTLAAAVALPGAWSLELLHRTVTYFETVPWGHYWVVGPSLFALVLFYSMLAMGLAIQPLRRRWQWVLVATTAVLLISWQFPRPTNTDSLRVTFLSVGHGTCVILELPHGETWLYDAGRLGSSQSAVGEISSYLWSRRVTKLNGVVLSHADLDHFNAVPGLSRRFPITTVYTSSAMRSAEDPSAVALFAELERRGIRLEILAAGRQLMPMEGLAFRVLHPGRENLQAADNEQSLVISVEFRGKRILLPGDIEGDGLRSLMADDAIDCDLVLAPHHGSPHSQPLDFAHWSTPEWVVISGGQRRIAEAGRVAFEQAGARVLTTSDAGAVVAIVDDGPLVVESHLR